MYHSATKILYCVQVEGVPKRIIVYLTKEQHVRKRMKEKGGMDTPTTSSWVLAAGMRNEKINDAGKGCVFM